MRGGRRARARAAPSCARPAFLSSRSPPQEGDWRWQLRHAIGSVEELAAALPLTASELEGAQRAESQGLPLRITPYYLSLVDRDDPACPIRLQCVPDAREAETVAGDMVDPLGEVAHEVAPHLVQRYPDRALFLATDRCAVYCRFCTRSRMVGGGDGAVSLEELAPALCLAARPPRGARRHHLRRRPSRDGDGPRRARRAGRARRALASRPSAWPRACPSRCPCASPPSWSRRCGRCIRSG